MQRCNCRVSVYTAAMWVGRVMEAFDFNVVECVVVMFEVILLRLFYYVFSRQVFWQDETFII